MSKVLRVDEIVDDELAEPREVRLQRDAAKVAELTLAGFTGREYEVFEHELLGTVWRVLRGMVRTGKLVRVAQRKLATKGRGFQVAPE